MKFVENRERNKYFKAIQQFNREEKVKSNLFRKKKIFE